MRGETEAGVTIITVLIIMAVVSGLSLNLANLTQTATRDSDSRHLHHSLYYATLQGEALAMAALTNAYQKNGNLAPTALPALPELPQISVHDSFRVGITIDLQDLQGRFNLSNLISTKDHSIAESLLLAYTNYCQELQLAPKVCSELLRKVGAIENTKGGSGTSDYSVLFQAMNNIIRAGDVNQQQAAIIAHAFTALPRGTSVNYNTASVALLRAIAPDLSHDTLKTFLASRQRHDRNVTPLTSVDPVISALSRGGVPVGATSQYFAVNTMASHETLQRALQSVMQLDLSTGETQLVYRRTLEFAPVNTPQEIAEL